MILLFQKFIGSHFVETVIPLKHDKSLNQFFMVPENRNIVQLTALMQAAEAFFILNPLVDHDQFMAEIREYAIQEKIN